MSAVCEQPRSPTVPDFPGPSPWAPPVNALHTTASIDGSTFNHFIVNTLVHCKGQESTEYSKVNMRWMYSVCVMEWTVTLNVFVLNAQSKKATATRKHEAFKRNDSGD